MFFPFAIVPFYLVLMFLYWRARNRGDLKATAWVQPMLTALAVLVAAMAFFSPHNEPPYTFWILIGLFLSFIADVFNIDMNRPGILYAAIAVFVVAYLTYAITFTRFSGFRWQDLIVGAVFLVIYIILMRLYWKGLGQFRVPVLIYGLVMPFMVTRAISTLYGGVFSAVSAILVTAGTTALFLGDVEYGLHRFYKPRKFFLGPLLYSGGQLLIALSCTFFLL